jgi:hypothetical protein
MDPVTLVSYRNSPSLSFRLHAEARRERARAIARLFARLVESVTTPGLADTWLVRWG